MSKNNFDNAWLQQYLKKLTPEEQQEFFQVNSHFQKHDLKESVLETAFKASLKLRIPENADWVLKDMLQEHYFYSERNFRFDFAWVEAKAVEVKVAVEIHGLFSTDGSPGRHLRPLGFENDREKMNIAQLEGWLVLEITQNQIESGIAFLWLLAAFERSGVKVNR